MANPNVTSIDEPMPAPPGPITLPAEIKTSAANCLQLAGTIKIMSVESKAAAVEQIQQWKGYRDAIKSYHADAKRAADTLHKFIVAQEKHWLAPFEDADKIARAAIQDFDRAEAAKLEEARRKAQAIADEAARKEREKAEAAARIEREKAQEAERKAREAREAAEKEQNAKAREKLLAEAAKQEAKAEVSAERADSRASEAAAVVAPTVSVSAPSQQKVAGYSERKSWVAEVTDLDAFISAAVAANRLELLSVNDKALQAFAKSMRSRAKLNGVTFKEVTSSAIRGTK